MWENTNYCPAKIKNDSGIPGQMFMLKFFLNTILVRSINSALVILH